MPDTLCAGETEMNETRFSVLEELSQDSDRNGAR